MLVQRLSMAASGAAYPGDVRAQELKNNRDICPCKQ